MNTNYLYLIVFLSILLLASCSAVESTGDAISDAGRGAGHAISGVSEAVGDAGSAVGEGAGDIVSGTGRAIRKGAKNTENKGY